MASELLGVPELTEVLRALGKLDDGRIIRSATRAAGNKALAAARAAAPERTTDAGGVMRRTYKGREVGPGFGKRSVKQVVILSKDKQLAAALIGVAPEAFYMVNFVEVGNSFQAPRPWLVPAFEASRSEALKSMSRSMASALRRIIKQKSKKPKKAVRK